MSRKNEIWRKNLVRNCLKECVHQFVMDPFGLCLQRFQEKKYSPPMKTRKNLLNDFNEAAKELLPSLTDPVQKERCQEIIDRTQHDSRTRPSTWYTRHGVEQVDMFATDDENGNINSI